MLNEVSIALMENSLDFIERGLKSIITDNESELKYAVLHLFSGILLFLKDVLYKEHWTLIFNDIDSANKAKLLDGDFKSVDFHNLLNRLEATGSIDILPKLKNDLSWMRKQRNKIEHLHNDLNQNEVKARIASLLNNLYDTLQVHKTSKEDYVVEEDAFFDYEYNSLFELIQIYSFKFDDFIQKRKAIIKNKIQQSYIAILCPCCKQRALEIQPDENKCMCHFCLRMWNTKEFYYENSKEHINEIKYGYEKTPCPNCQSTKLYKSYTDAVCFKCFEVFNSSYFNECARCGASIVYTEEEGGFAFCDSCISFIQSQ